MYTPSAFAESNPETLAKFIRQHSFATLISEHEKLMTASHLPILLDCSEGKPARLLGHMARANGQWQEAEGREVLVIFQGPHAYISPRWYAERNTVPTWNYAAVHAYGTFRLLDASQTRELLIRTVQEYEAPLESPWSMEENDPEFMEKLLPLIVGFRIEITHLEGKWKLNQNHSHERRERVIGQLRGQAGFNNLAIADLMEESLSSESSE
jgi:transcriptional regulator